MYEGMILTFRDHETTRVPSTQPTTTKLPRFSACREVLCHGTVKAVSTRVRDKPRTRRNTNLSEYRKDFMRLQRSDDYGDGEGTMNRSPEERCPHWILELTDSTRLPTDDLLCDDCTAKVGPIVPLRSTYVDLDDDFSGDGLSLLRRHYS